MKFLMILATLILASCSASDSSLKGVGDTVNPWSLRWFNAPQTGTMYNSADHLGAVFVLESFFQTCSYCNENAPNVDALATAYKDDARVQILDIGIDKTDRSYQLWVSQHNPNHPVLMDTAKTLTNQLGTTGYPSTYVLDCTMKVLYKSTGVWDSATKKELKDQIDGLLVKSICPL